MVSTSLTVRLNTDQGLLSSSVATRQPARNFSERAACSGKAPRELSRLSALGAIWPSESLFSTKGMKSRSGRAAPEIVMSQGFSGKAMGFSTANRSL